MRAPDLVEQLAHVLHRLVGLRRRRRPAHQHALRRHGWCSPPARARRCARRSPRRCTYRTGCCVPRADRGHCACGGAGAAWQCSGAIPMKYPEWEEIRSSWRFKGRDIPMLDARHAELHGAADRAHAGRPEGRRRGHHRRALRGERGRACTPACRPPSGWPRQARAPAVGALPVGLRPGPRPRRVRAPEGGRLRRRRDPAGDPTTTRPRRTSCAPRRRSRRRSTRRSTPARSRSSSARTRPAAPMPSPSRSPSAPRATSA